MKILPALAILLAWAAATGAENEGEPPGGQSAAATPEPTQYSYEVVRTLPHDRGAFTQGLLCLDGQFLESTGLNGQSSLRKVERASGRVLQQVAVPAEYFAEGLAVLGGKAYQLTWQSHKGFVYDLESLRLAGEFAYAGEGWGLTSDGQQLILSDGTDQIRFLEAGSFAVKRTIHVRFRGHPVDRLNELEYVKGTILANVWGTDYVVQIDPRTGDIGGVIDFSGLLTPADRTPATDVLNGIAYDAGTDQLYVTGKRWPKLFEVRLKPK